MNSNLLATKLAEKLESAGWDMTDYGSRHCLKCDIYFEDGSFCLECGSELVHRHESAKDQLHRFIQEILGE